MQPTTVPEPVFINLEYIFFLIYRVAVKVGTYIFSADFLQLINIIFTILVIVLIAGVLFCIVRLYEIKQEDELAKKQAKVVSSVETEMMTPLSAQQLTWNHIRDRLLSDNQSDWRLAIIEADIMLDRLLDNRGYRGETISDKLKQIRVEDMPEVQMMWEAHKVRNRIAHEGSAFMLTQPEARKVLSYYEISFRSFGVIE